MGDFESHEARLDREYEERTGCTCGGDAVWCLKCGYHQDGPAVFRQLQ